MLDATRQRIYRFFICRAVGNYFEGPIGLEQLDVRLRDGTIELRGLALNVAATNELLKAQPFRVVTGHIDYLQCAVTSLRSKAVTIHVRGVRVTLEPSNASGGDSAAASPEGTRASPVADAEASADGTPDAAAARGASDGMTPPIAPTEETTAGVAFVAQMIEQIMSRLEVCVSDLRVSVVDPESRVREISLLLPRLQMEDESTRPTAGGASACMHKVRFRWDGLPV